MQVRKKHLGAEGKKSTHLTKNSFLFQFTDRFYFWIAFFSLTAIPILTTKRVREAINRTIDKKARMIEPKKSPDEYQRKNPS